MELSPDAVLPFVVLTIGVPILLVSGAVLAFIGLFYGLIALRAMRDRRISSSLRLVALYLLEPSVTVTTLVALLMGAGSVSNTLGLSPQTILFIAPLIAGIPLSLMLLAPLFAPATTPFRNAIAFWGVLRWANTVALWLLLLLMQALGMNTVSNDEIPFLMIAAALGASVVVILWLSILKIVPILRELRAVEKV